MGRRRTLIFALPALLIATAWPQPALAQNQINSFDPPGAGTAAGQGTVVLQNLNSGAIVGYLRRCEQCGSRFPAKHPRQVHNHRCPGGRGVHKP